MIGKLVGGGIAVLALVALLAPSAAGRGGNHGCNPADREVFSSHYFKSGDNIVVGYYTQEVGFPSSTQETIRAENSGSDGSGPSGLTCSGDEFTWTLVRSALGPGDDSIRFDGVGLQSKLPAPARALPRRVATLVTGSTGDDLLRGHSGFDDLSGGGNDDTLVPGGGRDRVRGGAGKDLVKAAGGGKDNVKCGAGRDKAIVDERDDVRGCEDLVER